jgi:hypothetical protein
MQTQTTQQTGVRHQGPVNRNKYRGCSWESREGNQQVAKDEGKKVLPWLSMDTPHPSTDTGSGTVGCTTCRDKGWCRGYGRVITSTHTETEKKDRKVHLYGQTMIARTSPQMGKSHKRRSTRNSYRQEKSNCRGYHKNKGGANRNRRRTQGKNYHKPVEMVRMKKTHSKRSPQGKEPLISPQEDYKDGASGQRSQGYFSYAGRTKGKSDHHQVGERNQY